jgi:endoglucanase
MRLFRSLLVPLVAVLGSVLAPAAAQATAGFDPNGFRFSSSTYTVHENQGQAVITVVRNDASQRATAYYVAVGIGHDCGGVQCNAMPPNHGDDPADFGATQGGLQFAAGQTTATFTVPIVDHGYASIPRTLQLAIFNAWNQGLADPNHAVLTIINDDPSPARDPNNPLMLPVAPTNGDPMSGAKFFVDPDSEPAQAARQFPLINVIASQPGAARFGSFSGPDVGFAVSRFLTRAAVQQPGTVPMLATYRLVDGHCGNYTPPPSAVAAYHDFVTSFAQGIGSHPAVLFLEMDSLITTPCLTRTGLAIRLGELHDAINVLTANCPHLVIYMDAGAGDAIPAGPTASDLLRAGISQIQGFFLNSTHFDWTSNEIRFGEAVSRLTGGKHFVVNTGDNGRGPLVPPDPVHQGNEVLCNPAGRGLGPKPTANTGFPNVDAFAWTTNPGESGGACVPGAPPTGAYWPGYALMLIRNADFNVDDHAAASAARAGHRHHKRHRHHRRRLATNRTHTVHRHHRRHHRRAILARMD